MCQAPCDDLFVHLLIYGSGAMVWQEEKRSMITSVQIGNPTNLLGIRRIDIIPKRGSDASRSE